jgi:hypothetical protein
VVVGGAVAVSGVDVSCLTINSSVGSGEREAGSTVESDGPGKTSPSIKDLWPSWELKSS